MQNLALAFESNPKQEDLEVIGGNLSRFNTAYVGYDDFAALTIFSRNEQGNIAGGLVGATYWE